MSIFLKESDLNSMRRSGRILADAIKEAKKHILPGMKTAFIDEIVEKFIVQRGARPAFKGYRGFPASVCISINEQVVHGIPGERVIHDGDLVSLDIGVDYQGYYTDAAFSVVAGNGNGIAYQLVKVAKESLFEGIQKAKVGNRIGDISNAIQKYIEKNNFSVVRDFVGHGLGLSLHEEPQIPNFGPRNQGPLIKKGMVLAIEPMVNEKGFQVQILDDGWTVVTRDQGLSAHYEHTVLITEDGPDILTMDRRGDE
ncbi:MAG TPA: type I methionyl aminopeptidase [Candidatus Atribacteria bacterium]|nr:type I methionyl aminopeptidase [Candidatus Atribacteria bacterium]HCU23067.1 type I methionyl aminopeptidase [Candidatus Atribacteria bacterium]